MERTTFTVPERTILANQYSLLEKVDKTNEKRYTYLREIVECGYEGLYLEIYSQIDKPVTFDICDETYDILDMFRAIEIAKKNLTTEQLASINLNKITFEGFDFNNDPHSSFAKFIVKVSGKYLEQQKATFNSGSSNTIFMYRRLLKYYKSKIEGQIYTLTYTDLLEMSDI
jgi:uncharacterized protein YfbU (UPF0304 family)